MPARQPPQSRNLFEPPWKKQRNPGGVEWYNYPSALARHVLLYPRAVGLATSPQGFQNEHHSDNGYLLHFMQKGKLWYRVNGRTHTIRAGEAGLFDVGEDVGTATTGRAKRGSTGFSSMAATWNDSTRNCARTGVRCSLRLMPHR